MHNKRKFLAELLIQQIVSYTCTTNSWNKSSPNRIWRKNIVYSFLKSKETFSLRNTCYPDIFPAGSTLPVLFTYNQIYCSRNRTGLTSWRSNEGSGRFDTFRSAMWLTYERTDKLFESHNRDLAKKMQDSIQVISTQLIEIEIVFEKV